MQPYQKASEEIRNQGTAPLNALKTVGKLGINAAGSALAYNAGRQVMSKALNFLNPYIPEQIAKKGLDKIDPRFGKFIKKAEENGYDFDEISDFIKDKASGNQENEQQKNEEPKDDRNVIEKYSPELHQFISNEVKNGRPALHAAAIAQNDKRFSDIIKKLAKDYKTNWSNIVEGIYGNGQTGQSQAALQEDALNPPFSQPPNSQTAEGQAQRSLNNNQNSIPKGGLNPALQKYSMDQSQQGQGQGQQALMSILQKINQRLGQ